MENIIFIGSYYALSECVEMIVSKAKTHHPEKFEGNRDFFNFDLRYVAPFDHNFNELKRLQGTAAEAAGRRDEFRGYISVNLSAYMAHELEEYFNKILYFLADMNEEWKYIFFIDANNAKYKPARELIARVLDVFLRTNIPCQVMEMEDKRSVREIIRSVCSEQNSDFDPGAEDLLCELLTQGVCNENIVTALIKTVGWNYGPQISKSLLIDYLTNRGSVLRYMMTEKEYSRLVGFVEKWREHNYGEKEAV